MTCPCAGTDRPPGINLLTATGTVQVLCNHIDRLFEGTCDVPQLLAPTTFAGAHLTRMQPQARARHVAAASSHLAM